MDLGHSVFAGWFDRDPIAYHASSRPAVTAVIERLTGETLTYAALDARVARTAGWLAAKGVGQGDRVAYLGRNCIVQLAVTFACRRLGAIFAPLNWRLSGAEVAVIAADAQPALLLADVEFRDCAAVAMKSLPDTCYVELTSDKAGFNDEVEAAPLLDPAPMPPDAPYIILYTSGTTGRPKGVVITRLNAFFGAYNFAGVGRVGASSVMLCDAPMFHTVGLMAVSQTAMHVGATVIMSDRFLPEVTLKLLSDPALRISHYFAVPQIAQMLRDHSDYPASDLSRLTALFTGGAPMPPTLIEAFLDDGVTLANGYGMTEVGTTLCMPLDRDVIRGRLASSGVAAPTALLKIVRKDGTPAAIGESGEIWIKGPGVMPGYWNRPEENAKAFVDGWFRSGDAGYVDEQGYYVLLDRWKDMYITGGENVYPAEVEAVLARIPGIAECAVVGVPDDRWGESGLAFVVADKDAGLCGEDIIRACQPHLARYKQPRSVRFLEALPRTASGKVKKDVLRDLATEG